MIAASWPSAPRSSWFSSLRQFMWASGQVRPLKQRHPLTQSTLQPCYLALSATKRRSSSALALFQLRKKKQEWWSSMLSRYYWRLWALTHVCRQRTALLGLLAAYESTRHWSSSTKYRASWWARSRAWRLALLWLVSGISSSRMTQSCTTTLRCLCMQYRVPVSSISAHAFHCFAISIVYSRP